MNKVYSPIVWENKPSIETPINAQNLNKMDTALNIIDNRVISQDTTKANKSELSNLVSDWDINKKTGIITVTKHDGSKILFDLNIEKIPVGFKLSKDGILTMTTDDGTEFTANIGSMIPVLQFNDSDTILVNASGSGVNRTYSFDIRQGSITDEMLESGYLAEITTKVEESKTYSDNAGNYAKLSQSYAVGGTNTRENENTDNAKYYYEQVEAMHEDYARGQVTGVKGNNEENYRSGNVNLTAKNIGATQHIDLTGQVQTSNYRRSVIALCKTGADKAEINSYSSGAIAFHRRNGISVSEAKIDFFISSSYDLENYINALFKVSSKSSGSILKPCTFIYNEVTYGGLDIYIFAAESNSVTFDGTTNFDIFGLDYYDTRNNIAINEEVYNSLNYDSITWLNNNTLNGEQIATEADITEATSEIKTTSKGTLSDAGWYRVAEFSGVNLSAVIGGAYPHLCELLIKRRYDTKSNETHRIQFSMIYQSYVFKSLESLSNYQLFKKIRYTYNASELKGYIEVYYNESVSNACQFEILYGKNVETLFKAITPTLTEEAIDGVTVSAIYDIPANLTPASNLDLQDAVDNIEIGGTNLLADTNSTSAIYATNETYRGLVVRHCDNSGGTIHYDMSTSTLKDIEPDTQYTLSFYAKGSGDISTYLYPYCIVSGYSNLGVSAGESDGHIRHTLTTDWKRYVITYTTTSTFKGDEKIIPVRIWQGTNAYICGIKLEKGNKATDWSPAPGDTTKIASDIVYEATDGGYTKRFTYDIDLSEYATDTYTTLLAWIPLFSFQTYATEGAVNESINFRLSVLANGTSELGGNTFNGFIDNNTGTINGYGYCNMSYSGFVMNNINIVRTFDENNKEVFTLYVRLRTDSNKDYIVNSSAIVAEVFPTKYIEVEKVKSITPILDADFKGVFTCTKFPHSGFHADTISLGYLEGLNEVVYFGNNEHGICHINNDGLMPDGDGGADLGASNEKWRNIYASNGTIQTSDRTQKTDIVDLDDDRAKNFIMGLNPSTYKMINGTSDRTHWGLISQDVEQLLENMGLSSTDFAGFIKTPKVIAKTIVDERTKKRHIEYTEVEGEYEYSLRYDEFIAPIIKVIQKQQQEINMLKAMLGLE